MTVRRVPEGHYIELKKDNINSIEQLADVLYAEYDMSTVGYFLKCIYSHIQTYKTAYVVCDNGSYSRISKALTSDYKLYQLQQQLGEIAWNNTYY